MISRLLSFCIAAVVGLGAPGICQQQRLPTLFSSDNGGSPGGVVYFDLANTQPILLQQLDLNLAAALGTAIQVTVFALPLGTGHSGNETSGAWTAIATDDGSARTVDIDQPTLVPLRAQRVLESGTRGVAVVVQGAGHRYTNGTGTNQNFADGIVTLNLGSAGNLPFQPLVFAPRVWNGAVRYTAFTGLHPAFYATPVSGPAPLIVTFTDATATVDPLGVNLVQWDVDGDGNYDYTGATAQHTYATGGRYSVALRVRDAIHGTATATRTDYIVVGSVAPRFTWSAVSGTPTGIQFVDGTTPTPSAWSWDFDADGNVDSTAQNPLHTYPRPGIWRCRLTATAPGGTFQFEDTVLVQTLEQPAFTNTYTFPSNTRGFWFQAPRSFSIVTARVPNEAGLALQNLAVYRLANAPPTAPTTVPASPAFVALGAPRDVEVPIALSFAAGEFVGVLGATGDANAMASSYGTSPFNTQLLGSPLVLSRLRADVNLVTTGGVLPLSSGSGSLARVELAISAALAFEYGTGTASGTGADAPHLATSSLPMLGNQATLSFSQTDPGVFGALLGAFGRGLLPTPFGPVHVDPATMFSFGIGAIPIGTGSISFLMPNQPAFQGAGPVCWQLVCAVAGSPNSLALSNGVEWFLGL